MIRIRTWPLWARTLLVGLVTGIGAGVGVLFAGLFIGDVGWWPLVISAGFGGPAAAGAFLLTDRISRESS